VDIELNLMTETVEHAWPAEPLCVTSQVSIREVFQRLKENKTGAVLVCRDGVLVGIFTERDALKIMASSGNLDAPIESVMVRNPATVPASEKVGVAIQKMSSGGYRNLPIVDDRGRPKGVLQVAGIVHYLVEHFPKSIYNLPPVAHHVMQQREGS
jgi:CBS domain-containing protein